MMNIALSIIIPIYNTELYLRECLESVRIQTFSDFEVWMIDDGSTDCSGSICDEYVLTDNRFHVIHVANGGVSKARNIGIKKAQGKMMAFVDSDDTLMSTCFQHLMEHIKSDTGIVIANYGGERGNDLIKKNVQITGARMKTYFIEHSIFAQSGPCQKLFCSDVIKKNDILFPLDIHMGEDMIFFIRYMNCINSATLVTSNEYLVRSHDGSLSTKYYSYESERKCFELWYDEITKFVSSLSCSELKKNKAVWETRTTQTFLRLLECLYKANVDMNFRQKLSILNSIDKSELSLFIKYYNPDKLSSKILKFLVSYRFFILFLLAGRFHNTFK